jgi:hypothetical protein
MLQNGSNKKKKKSFLHNFPYLSIHRRFAISLSNYGPVITRAHAVSNNYTHKYLHIFQILLAC